jgi:hypothetical protein
MPIERNLLLLKSPQTLDADEKSLYDSYKGKVENLLELATKRERKEWDFVTDVLHSLHFLLLKFENIYPLYRAFIDVTSYYHHAMPATIGAFNVRLLTKLGPTNNLRREFNLEKLPKFLDLKEYEWTGDDEENIQCDLVNRFKNCLIWMDLKTRVDTMCTGGRREIWVSKFKKILELLISEKTLYKSKTQNISLLSLLRNANLHHLNLWCGILFDIKGKPATSQADKNFQLCWKGMEDGYKEVLNFLDQSKVSYEKVEPSSEEECFILRINFKGLEINIGTKYANKAVEALFAGENVGGISVLETTMKKLQYDDLWLSQLIAISERCLLFQRNDNYLLSVTNILREDNKVVSLLGKWKKTTDLNVLEKLVSYIREKYSSRLNTFPTPIFVSIMQALGEKYTINDYLGDLLQLLVAKLLSQRKFGLLFQSKLT